MENTAKHIKTFSHDVLVNELMEIKKGIILLIHDVEEEMKRVEKLDIKDEEKTRKYINLCLEQSTYGCIFENFTFFFDDNIPEMNNKFLKDYLKIIEDRSIEIMKKIPTN